MAKGEIDIKRAVKESREVHFDFYRAGLLYYKTCYGETFSVPIDDVGDATFNCTEKGIMLMRYMRKWNEALDE